MKRFLKVAVLVTFIVITCAMNAFAWEVVYDASAGLLPAGASPAWTSVILGDNTAAVSDGVLRIQHVTGSSYYSREEWAISAGIPVTMEARMRVGASSIGAPRLSIQTKGCYAYLKIYPDHLAAIDYSGGGSMIFSGDFTTFRTIRLAYDGNNRMYAWVDGQPAFSGGTGYSGQDGVNFGSYLGVEPCDSYWQYVAYSKEFLPVPEPSSLLALAGGLAGLGGMALRRRKR